VSCPADGAVVVQVPWADHGACFRRSFDDQVAVLAVECSRTAVSELMRIAWRSVGSALTRVSGRLEQGKDLNGPRSGPVTISMLVNVPIPLADWNVHPSDSGAFKSF
jgi:hypothetical protein